MNKEQKTIFIIVTRSIITRNILRSGTLQLLKGAGFKIVVFFQSGSVPAYLKEEFEDDRVTLLSQQHNLTGFHRRFLVVKKYLLDSDTTRLLAHFRESRAKRQQHKNLPKKSRLLIYLRLFLISFISKISFAKKIFRLIDFYIFSEKSSSIKEYFNIYKPDVVFSTSILSTLDIVFMKEARRRNIKTVSMQKGWDNLLNGYYRFIPDYFLVPNEMSVDIASENQGIKKENIFVTGMPQFDWYTNKSILKNRKEHFINKGLDPNRALIFFGSEGIWATHDHQIAEKIHNWILKNELVKPCQLIARPHYTNVASDVFKNLRGKKHVVVDDYRTTNFLVDFWDPSVKETIDFTNSVYHCDIMINIASTLALDAAAVDRPIISVLFGCSYQDGKDISREALYGANHDKWVLGSKATSLAYNFEELKEKINNYLLNPVQKQEERRNLVRTLCYKVDGNSSQRLVGAIIKIVST